MKRWISILIIISITLNIPVEVLAYDSFENIVDTTVKTQIMNFQVIVVGSDPEGIAAAVSAARNGLKTLLIDHRDRVGGLYTVGWLNMLDLNYKGKNTREIVNKGIFLEFHRSVGGGASFDIPTAQRVFEDMLKKSRVKVMLEVSDIKPIIKENTIRGVTFKYRGIKYNVFGKVVIDSTQDADIAAMCGVPYKFGREDFGFPGDVGAVTLMFSLKNVNWQKVVTYLQNDGNPFTGANNTSAWGYAVMFKAPTKDLSIQIRGLNIGKQKDGTVVINALQIFNVNPLVKEEKKAAIEKAKRELPAIIEFMRKNAPGFEKAELVGVAPELYVRESRHIEGEYTLTADDVFENRNQEIAVAFGSYPIDIQARKKGEAGVALSGTNPYGIPFGVMVPKKIEGLLVASRCASYDTIAHGSARTVPVGMALGQAAGVAAKYAITKKISFREIAHSYKAIMEIRAILKKQGVDLTPIKIEHPEKKSWAYPYIRRLRNKAMLSKGYQNDYRLNDTATMNTFNKMFSLINCHSKLKIDTKFLKDFREDQPITAKDYIRILNKILNSNYNDIEELFKEKIIDETTYLQIIRKNGYLSNAEAYALVDGLVQYMERQYVPEYRLPGKAVKGGIQISRLSELRKTVRILWNFGNED
ncbi:FAD-dependent oxidoreductase [Thermovenabulum sp.]|uniref:FAD-dependent oxidoreductase n=1 Tax=Thermovenabulum sp. TaxID=3100335 RepID=UPI003C7A91F8